MGGKRRQITVFLKRKRKRQVTGFEHPINHDSYMREKKKKKKKRMKQAE